MTDEEFNEIMATGLAQAKSGKSNEIDAIFDRLISEVEEASEEETKEVLAAFKSLTEDDLEIVKTKRFPE